MGQLAASQVPVNAFILAGEMGMIFFATQKIGDLRDVFSGLPQPIDK